MARVLVGDSRGPGFVSKPEKRYHDLHSCQVHKLKEYEQAGNGVSRTTAEYFFSLLPPLCVPHLCVPCGRELIMDSEGDIEIAS